MSEKKDITPKLHSFFEETGGGYSMTRLRSFGFCVLLFAVLGFAAWKSISLAVAGTPVVIPEVPPGWLWLTAIFVTGQAAGKWIEVKGETDQTKLNSPTLPTPLTPPAA